MRVNFAILQGDDWQETTSEPIHRGHVSLYLDDGEDWPRLEIRQNGDDLEISWQSTGARTDLSVLPTSGNSIILRPTRR